VLNYRNKLDKNTKVRRLIEGFSGTTWSWLSQLGSFYVFF